MSAMGTSGAVGSSSKGRSMADHMLFYSVCQATFYIMCFRGDELAATEGFRNQVGFWGIRGSGPAWGAGLSISVGFRPGSFFFAFV